MFKKTLTFFVPKLVMYCRKFCEAFFIDKIIYNTPKKYYNFDIFAQKYYRLVEFK